MFYRRLKTRDAEGDLISETDDIAAKTQILNNFFISVFTNEDTTNIPAFENRCNGMALEQITEELVEKKLIKH